MRDEAIAFIALNVGMNWKGNESTSDVVDRIIRAADIFTAWNTGKPFRPNIDEFAKEFANE